MTVEEVYSGGAPRGKAHRRAAGRRPAIGRVAARAVRGDRAVGRVGAALALAAALALPLLAAGGPARAGEAAPPAASPPAAAPRFSLGVHEKTLENGLQVLTVEQPGAPRATCWLFYKTGSVNERPGITGISHLFEHLMFKGTRRIGVRDIALDEKLQPAIDAAWEALRAAKDEAARAAAEARFRELRQAEKKNDIQDELWDLYLASGGTGLNAYTSEDVTVYVVTLPANRIELFFWLEADRMQHAVFREFYAERDVVKEERRLDENAPDGPYYEELNALAFLAHPYHWPILGWMSDLDAITPEDCRRYFEVHYAPNNAILVLVGGVRHEAVEALAERYFGKIPRGKVTPPAVRTVEPEPAGERRLTVEAEARARATLTFVGPAALEADGPALDVAAAVLGGFSGRLWLRLVDELELAAETSADYTRRRYAGVFTVEGYVKGEHTPEEVAGALQAELDALAEKGPTEDELARARTRLEADLIKKLEDPETLTEAIGWWAACGDWRYLERLPALWRAVSADDVRRVARRYLAAKRRTLGILREPAGTASEEEATR